MVESFGCDHNGVFCRAGEVFGRFFGSGGDFGSAFTFHFDSAVGCYFHYSRV